MDSEQIKKIVDKLREKSDEYAEDYNDSEDEEHRRKLDLKCDFLRAVANAIEESL